LNVNDYEVVKDVDMYSSAQVGHFLNRFMIKRLSVCNKLVSF
jgi:hypothetical protein